MKRGGHAAKVIPSKRLSMKLFGGGGREHRKKKKSNETSGQTGWKFKCDNRYQRKDCVITKSAARTRSRPM